jgi:inorganic pyrophosphatase
MALELETENIPLSLPLETFPEHLVATCPVFIDCRRNLPHTHYMNIVYPLDYGYLDGTTTIGGDRVDASMGGS